MLRFKKAILLLFVLAFVAVGASVGAQTKKVYVAGWWRNDWKNNILEPLGIEAVIGDWIPHTQWDDYDTIIFTQGTAKVEKLTEEQLQEVIRWVSAGNSIILANNSANLLIEAAETYNRPELAPLTGISYYNIQRNLAESAVVLDNQHQLTNNMSISHWNWKDETYYFAKVTTAQRLVGVNSTKAPQDKGLVFVNQIGAGSVYIIIPTPKADAPSDFLTLCKKAVLLACGGPIPEP